MQIEAGDMHGILCGREVNALRKFLAHVEGNRSNDQNLWMALGRVM